MMIPGERVRKILIREQERFVTERPRSRSLLERGRRSMPGGVPMSWMLSLYEHMPMFIAGGSGAYFTDVDGHRYLDMNQADLSMNCGYGPEPVVRAVAERMKQGSQFLLPTEDALVVAEELARRYGHSHWQFTLSASTANIEAIRLARAVTGRDTVLLFDGQYHGEINESLVELEDGEVRPGTAGLLRGAAECTRIVQFNDLDAVESVLGDGDVACVVTEPALTNIGVILPDDGFLHAMKEIAHRHGTLVVLDETHTQVCAYGGLTRAWGIESDMIVLGKCLAGGVSIGTYGMAEEIGCHLRGGWQADPAGQDSGKGVATGGTLFGNALSLAAARATLEQVLTEETYARGAALGGRLADGIEAAFQKANLAWSVQRLFCRSGYTFAPQLPRNALEARAVENPELRGLMRVYFANRGIWEAISSAGPAASFPATAGDMGRYVAVLEEFLDEITS
ncbi:MAG: transaminase [Acidobacteria bacterium]|nr:transaminase [Acidobacteriota bacterium]